MQYSVPSIKNIIFIIVITLILSTPAVVAAPQSFSLQSTVSASIGEYRFFLYGFTSAYAVVSLEGIGLFDQTTSDKDGYFAFANRFSPFSAREACLSSRDQFGRTSNLTCLPPFPIKYDVDIGPVILPPTVSLNKQNYYVGDEVVLSGQTIPNTDVDLSFFIEENRSLFQGVRAASIPELQTKSDKKGNFSISLPSSTADRFRLFTRTYFESQSSPKSTILNLRIFPWWMIIFQLFGLLWTIIRSRILEIILVVQIVALVIYFLRRYLHPHAIAVNRSLVVREKHPLVEA